MKTFLLYLLLTAGVVTGTVVVVNVIKSPETPATPQAATQLVTNDSSPSPTVAQPTAGETAPTASSAEPATETIVPAVPSTEAPSDTTSDPEPTPTASRVVFDADCLGKDAAFLPFANTLTISCDSTYMYITADSLADDPMMVGITLWNHQVPLPQLFVGSNTWKIPLHPKPLSSPQATTGQGPIGVAINGVMIYNPTQQDGIYTEAKDPLLIGELGVCGGHSGRADDYHYHVAPNCIINEVGEVYDKPIAYALDGYPIYGYYNADGSTPTLDECGGEDDPVIGYHYHARKTYPYVNGCFKGAFDMSLQPHTSPVREPNPLGHKPEVKITRLEFNYTDWSELEYTHQGTSYVIRYYPAGDNCYDFQFVSGGNVLHEETGCPGSSGGQGAPPDAPTAPSASAPAANTSASGFALHGTGFIGDEMPAATGCDGARVSPGLNWTGAPVNAESFAILMNSTDGPDKWYWMLYDIPSSETSVPQGGTAGGTLGTNSVKDVVVNGYEPPCSQGTGTKYYRFTIYALSGTVGADLNPQTATRDQFLSAISGQIIDQTEYVASFARYESTGEISSSPGAPPEPPSDVDSGRKYCGDGLCDNTESAAQCPVDCDV